MDSSSRQWQLTLHKFSCGLSLCIPLTNLWCHFKQKQSETMKQKETKWNYEAPLVPIRTSGFSIHHSYFVGDFSFLATSPLMIRWWICRLKVCPLYFFGESSFFAASLFVLLGRICAHSAMSNPPYLCLLVFSHEDEVEKAIFPQRRDERRSVRSWRIINEGRSSEDDCSLSKIRS